MKKIPLILALLLAVLTGSAWGGQIDTVYKPGQHSVVLPFQCDDRADSTFMGVFEERGLRLNFALYELAGNQIQDYDSNFTERGGYTDWLAGYAYRRGHGLASHASPLQAEIVADFGRDSLNALWDAEVEWLKSVSGVDDVPGFVWTGHRHSPETRAMAKSYGFSYTRGDMAYSKDLYLSALGWQSYTGADILLPISASHKIMVQSISPQRFDTGGVDTLHAAATDTTGIWRGTLNALSMMADRNAFGVYNIHSGWNTPYGETEADTLTWSWVRIPDTYAGAADSIRFGGRQGYDGSSFDSAYQIAYMLRACEWWNDSIEVATGAKRLCIPELNAFMARTDHNMRTDNTSDPDDVSDWSEFKAAAECDEPRWTSNTGLYAKDPAVDRTRKVYVDGTGAVRAGNGTQTYPLPRGAWDNLSDCEVVFVGNSAGDTLSITNPLKWRSGNVSIDFNGLELRPTDKNSPTITMKDASTSYLQQSVSFRNGSFNHKGSSDTDPMLYLYGGGATAGHDSLRVADMVIHGMRFRDGENGIYVYNAKGTVIDSCVFELGIGGLLGGNLSNVALKLGAVSSGAVIRNNVFDMNELGGGHASGASVAIYAAAATPDSIRIINNVFALGNADAPTTHTHRFLRSHTQTVNLNARIAGNYIANGNRKADDKDMIWWHDSGSELTYAQLVDTLALRDAGFAPTKNFIATGYSPGTFDYLADVQDTLIFGGYRGNGSLQQGRFHASIGPKLYEAEPMLWASPIARHPEYARFSTMQEIVNLINAGVLPQSSAGVLSTHYPVPAPDKAMGPDAARHALYRAEWSRLSESNRGKFRMRIQ